MEHTRLVIGIVSILIMNVGCKNDDKLTQPVIPDPVASFEVSGDTVTPAAMTFQNTSQHADSYLWEFGDGSTSTLTSPTKIFTAHGTFTVKLTATDTLHGRSSSMSKSVTITPGKVFVDVITVVQIPFTRENGSPWDIGSGPDLYPTLEDYTSQLVSFRSSYFNDLQPDHLPVNWILTPSYEITDWNKPHFVMCWDHDPLGDDDYIGATYGVTIKDVIQVYGYTAVVSLPSPGGSITADVNLRWQ